MLRTLARGLAGRLLGYGALLLGFWLLFKGVLAPNYAIAVLGGVAILGGMYLMVAARQPAVASPTDQLAARKEDGPGDSLDGSDQGDKFPP